MVPAARIPYGEAGKGRFETGEAPPAFKDRLPPLSGPA